MGVFVEVNMDKEREMKSFRLHMPEGGIFSGWTGRVVTFFIVMGAILKVLDMLK